ncbi:MAG: uracil phosphoribosyltransferase [Cyclobacteriaceae bacterium]|jgi:uracil phosphoribosyltransferase|nr:uracil phosphoribosyltransferase [Cyclobacteriaceae bacterium]
MEVNILSAPSVAAVFLADLRNVAVQGHRARFRKNLFRLGQVMAYELSKRLSYQPQAIQTPLAHTVAPALQQPPVLLAILRAGLPYFQGMQDFFDEADCGFMGAYRKEGENIEIQLDYLASPSLAHRTVILIDPMLATGRSLVRALHELKLRHGQPAHVHVAALIAAPEGIRYLEQQGVDATVWTFAVDEKLDERSYIVPGLGDAGDLSFGQKL